MADGEVAVSASSTARAVELRPSDATAPGNHVNARMEHLPSKWRHWWGKLSPPPSLNSKSLVNYSIRQSAGGVVTAGKSKTYSVERLAGIFEFQGERERER
jgi:hypothetical protein